MKTLIIYCGFVVDIGFIILNNMNLPYNVPRLSEDFLIY